MMMWAAVGPQSGQGEEAVKNAINIAQVLGGIVVGALAGLAAAIVLSVVLRMLLRKARLLASLFKRVRVPSYWALMLIGAFIGWKIAFAGTDLSTLSPWVRLVQHGLEILAIFGVTWTLFSAMWVFEDASRLRSAADQGRASRFETQAQVLRRLLQVVVVILGVGWVLSTFPSAQRVLTAVFASAGIASVIAGLAAQSTLGNVFAGIQLAFTDAIRVGDSVVVETQMGVIEEITLTYVVVRLWDERRLIMPSTLFTTQSFENWTRTAAKQTGTVELHVDWGAPVAAIRSKVQQLVLSTNLWDGRTWNVQVTEADQQSMTIRIVVSAKNSGDLWDLRCFLRENLLTWLASEQAWSRPLTRVQPTETVTVHRDNAGEQVARLASELAGIAATDTASGASAHSDEQSGTPSDSVHAARMKAARRKSKQARRRSLLRRSQELATQPDTPAKDFSSPASEATRIFTTAEIRAITGDGDTQAGSASPGHAAPDATQTLPVVRPTTTGGGAGERLWSGTPEAEERAKMFDGPGADVIAQRQRRAQQSEQQPAEKQERPEKQQSETQRSGLAEDNEPPSNVDSRNTPEEHRE